MRVEFTSPTKRSSGKNPPVQILAEAEVYFDAMTVGEGGHAVPSPFQGMKLVGFNVWRGERGIFVTFPSRAFGTDRERQYFDYVRAADPKDSAAASSALYRLKQWIADAYREWEPLHGTQEVPARNRTVGPDEEF